MGLVDDYRTDGAVILRGVITPKEIELLSVGIDAVIDCPSSRAKVASASDDPGFFLEDFTTWREHREFGEFLRSTQLPEIAASLTGSQTIALYHDHVLV